MDILDGLATGFGTLLSNPMLIAIVMAAVFAGMWVGALPGLTATMAMALLLPLTFQMDAEIAISALMGVFAGGIAGGSISAILLNVPGTPASAATVLDGFQMTRRGRAGEALGMAFVASAIGGLFSALLMSVAAPLIARIALNFQAPEFFVLAIYGLTIIAAVAGKSLLRGYVAGLFGLLIGTIGLDPITAQQRLTFGSFELYNGITLIPVLIGVFGMAQVFVMVRERSKATHLPEVTGRRLPTRRDLRNSGTTIARGSLIGSAIGIIPGTGTDIGAFLSYSEAKRRPKGDIPFGQGNPQGVAAAESANNAVVGGAMIPAFTLGIPGEAGSAVLLGALMIQGLTPGPSLLQGENATTMYVIFASFFVANLAILLFGLSGIRLLVRIVQIPPTILVPIISLLCLVGSYALNYRIFDVWVTIVAGLVGYFFIRHDFPVSPIILGMILGPMAETNLRRSLTATGGDWSVFFLRPISAVFWVLIVLSLIYVFRSSRKLKQAEVAAAEAIAGTLEQSLAPIEQPDEETAARGLAPTGSSPAGEVLPSDPSLSDHNKES